MPMTLQDRLEELSKAMVQAVCARAGVCYTQPGKDRISRDALFESVDRGLITDFPIIGAQLKATTQITIQRDDTDFPFDLPVKNYNDLRAQAQIPTILIVALIPADEALWLSMTHDQLVLRRCLYWRSLAGEPETTNETTIRVRMPINQVFDPAALVAMMESVRAGGSI